MVALSLVSDSDFIEDKLRINLKGKKMLPTTYSLDCSYSFDYTFKEQNYLKEGGEIGHLVSLEFPKKCRSLHKDKETFGEETQEKVVSVLKNFKWKGAAEDSIEISGRISFVNGAIVKRALYNNETEDPVKIELDVLTYEYDCEDERYKRKRLLYTRKPIFLKVNKVEITETDIRDEPGICFTMTLSGEEHKKQQYFHRDTSYKPSKQAIGFASKGGEQK